MQKDELEAAIANAITKVLASLTIPEETHREHHEFIKRWIAREDQRAARYERIKEKVGGWFFISMIGAIGKGAWDAYQYLQAHLK